MFAFWKDILNEQSQWGEGKNIPSLLWNLGVSLLERAMLDAISRAVGLPLQTVFQQNLLGIQPGDIHAELAGKELSDLIDFDAASTIYARHTVGMTDYLRASEIPEDELAGDGLPQAFEDCVRAYGISRYKIKLSGDIDRDVARMSDIATIVKENNVQDYGFTLDGNENFEHAADFKVLWEQLSSHPDVTEMLKHLIFVEQPIKRNYAFAQETADVFHNWPTKPPIIIDESDSEISSLPQALACGYQGTSHKNCKGVIKSVINTCLLNYKKQVDPDGDYLLSAEDLTNTGPVALLEDLTMAGLLGIGHIERNGHHYFRGLSAYSPELQQAVVAAHPDLYQMSQQGFATLQIKDGLISLTSMLAAPFGYGFPIDVTQFTPYKDWTYQSLLDL